MNEAIDETLTKNASLGLDSPIARGGANHYGMVARVFPRRTEATPTDVLAFVGEPKDNLIPTGIKEIHISVAFTYDIPKAMALKPMWEGIAPVKIGGPAFGKPGGEFEPGKYMGEGFTITSRGCHNHCWFCSVWKREPKLVELPIKDGWIVNDDNLLACSKEHILAVFTMLKRQPKRAQFKGGIEAKLLEDWHVELFRGIRVESIFLAYDTPDDKEPLIRAAKMLTPYFNRNKLYCYVLIGYDNDSFDKARERLQFVKSLGICPFAMLYRNNDGLTKADTEDLRWNKFQKSWCRPAAIYAKNRLPDVAPPSNRKGGVRCPTNQSDELTQVTSEAHP
jgi:hypothetical protein